MGYGHTSKAELAILAHFCSSVPMTQTNPQKAATIGSPEMERERNKIIARYFTNLRLICREHGVNIGPHIRAYHVSLKDAMDPSINQDIELYHKVILSLLRQGAIPGLGLQFASKMTLSDYGPFAYAVQSCANLGEALDLATRFVSITTELLAIDRGEQGDEVVISFRDLRPLAWPEPYMREAGLLEVWNAFTSLSPELSKQKGMRITANWPAPEYQALYKQKFPFKVLFNKDRCALYMPKAVLELPVQTADEELQRISAEQCRRINQQLQDQGSLIDKVRRQLLARPLHERFNLEEMANELEMPVRRFRALLYAEGQSYKQIVNDVRIEVAKQYLLGSTMTLQQIAYLAGYQHSNNFIRAFGNVVGLTPLQYRQA